MGTKDTITKDYMADNRVFADMFVERSRNKSIDKKSVLCYSESTNHVAIGIFVCDFSH